MTRAKRNPPVHGILFLRDAARGCEIVLASGASIAYPVYCHMASVVIGLVRGGRVRLSRNGRSECLNAGELFVIPPHQAHSLSATAPYAMLNLCLDAAELTHETIRSIGSILRALVRSGTLSGGECAALNRALCRVAAGWRQTRTDDPLDALRDGILADPERYPDLRSMADAVHVCVRHVARIFRLRHGLPPLRYRRQSRLRKARRELAAGGQSLVRVALRAGFFDQSHFIREFKKLYRMTPRQYLLALERPLAFLARE